MSFLFGESIWEMGANSILILHNVVLVLSGIVPSNRCCCSQFVSDILSQTGSCKEKEADWKDS